MSLLPKEPGVYLFKNRDGRVIYVGKAINLQRRVSSYFQNLAIHPPKTKALVADARTIEHIVTASEIEALLLEATLIKKYHPRYNIIWRDDKSYLYIKIDHTGAIPVIGTTRRELPRRGVRLFGPFPSGTIVRQVLRDIRRIFGYCSHQRQPNGSCLWIHLGLCPNPWQNQEALVQYKKTIAKITLLMLNKRNKLTLKLKKEMKESVRHEEFEQAAKLRDQITKLEYIASPARSPQAYMENPSLVEDERARRVEELRQVLNLPHPPKRIECYDISNTSGKNATGSMVVFTNGEPEKSQYRRFRIRRKSTPDDFAMIREVISRRFRNDWPSPDLIVIDGGKGQISAAWGAMQQSSIAIPVIGLAKRLEEIFRIEQNDTTPGWSVTGPIRLERTHPALQLLQSLRDEAHRFAITYHRKIRSKRALEG